MTLLSISLIPILILLLCLLVFLVIPQLVGPYRGKAPFIRTRQGVIGDIVDALKLQSRSVFYDLGCGDGRVLLAASKRFPDATCVGIEYDWFPFYLARYKTRGRPITIHHKDMFTVDLAPATHIYCYLLPETLAQLEPRIRKLCKVGTRIVTTDFKFPTLQIKEEISTSRATRAAGRKLYVYIVE